ncbi:MAG: beta-ketoacyl-[acyl-carrier-protein] synthase II, partial [Sediminispirochaetaceae bacterium]
DAEGKGAFLSMKMAVEQAGIEPSELDYINTHGTSTPVGDIAELKGVHQLIGESGCYVSSTKSYHGHLLGATAGLEAIITASALIHGTVPGNKNLFTPDPDLPELNLPTEHVKAEVKTALSNSFGFGGHNSSLLLRKFA